MTDYCLRGKNLHSFLTGRRLLGGFLLCLLREELLAVEALCGLCLDISGSGQRPLGQYRADKLQHKDGKQHDVAHQHAVCGEVLDHDGGHAECYACLG